MNCQAIQNRILALPDPREVGEPLRAHLVACPGCRAWAEQVARLEGLLESLPVPAAPAGKKDELVADLTRDPFALPAPARRPVAARGESFLARNAALVGGLAAAVLVAVGAWLAFSGNGGTSPLPAAATPKHPFLDRVAQRNVELAKVSAPADRLEVLAGLADDISAEARGLARIANPDELKDVAQWYERVVKNGMLTQAERLAAADLNVSAAERRSRLEAIAGKLSATASATEAMAAEVPQTAKPTLARIVTAARDGEKKLRELAE